ncbi:P-loop containing nucleoside triphosphate hydrolase protein [Globomyces pollinis-pini]|nr:P-loop containing nucleoside triphosphate hydrolase protein [Globomyces pollinis-pini]KAJ2995908.1 Ras- protein Rab-35 [Globomyces sp. JEL0801]
MVVSNLQPYTAGAEKVILLGSAGCGKTSLIQRFTSNAFSSDYLQSFGSEMYIKTATDHKKLSLNIWVLGGHVRYRTLLSQFYSDAGVALLCFDVMNIASFQELSFWYNEVKRNCPDATIYLVGLKADEPESLIVKIQDIIKLTKDLGVEYKATSAKLGTGIEELFDVILAKVSNY